MKTLWNTVNKLHFTKGGKNSAFLFLNAVFFSILGAVLWIPVHIYTLNCVFSLFYFVGYPGFFIGVVGGILYLYRHDF